MTERSEEMSIDGDDIVMAIEEEIIVDKSGKKIIEMGVYGNSVEATERFIDDRVNNYGELRHDDSDHAGIGSDAFSTSSVSAPSGKRMEGTWDNPGTMRSNRPGQAKPELN